MTDGKNLYLCSIANTTDSIYDRLKRAQDRRLAKVIQAGQGPGGNVLVVRSLYWRRSA
jgi:hypothetical protein